MKSTKKNTRDTLCETAWKLMQEKGIRRLRVKDICERAGVSKVSFYYYFDSKNDMVERIIRQWLKSLMDEAKDIIHQNRPFTERILKLIEWKGSFVRNFGGEFVRDLYDPEKGYLSLVRESMEESQRLIAEFYAFGKQQGEINRDVDTDVLIYWMNTVSDMIGDGRFIQYFDDTNDMFRQISSLLLYGMIGNTNKG
jgi:AcrR family transcriptional regulator